MSSVEGIINALSDLESNIGSLHKHVNEMKRRLLSLSNKEIESMRQQIIDIANAEAQKIITNAKLDAEKESVAIKSEGETSLTTLKRNIESFSPNAVDAIVKIILGDQKPNPVKRDSPSLVGKPSGRK